MNNKENNLGEKQSGINLIWSDVWKKQNKSEIKKILTNRLFVEGYAVFKKYLPNTPGQLIIDIGGGNGRYGIKFAQDFYNNKIIITDILQESLDLIKKSVEILNIGNIKIRKEDVFHLTFVDNSIDLIFCDVVIQHLPNYKEAVKEMARVLKPGGRLILANNNFWNFHTLYKWCLKIGQKKYRYGHEKSFTKKEMRELITGSGLRLIAEDGFYPAYGVYRLKNEIPRLAWLFSFLGKTINRLTKFLDFFTNRFFSRNFGVEIIVVGQK